MFPRSTFLLASMALFAPAVVFGQVAVLTSGGFAAAYQEVIPAFEKASGLKVTTTRGASQGSGPTTIPSQIRNGAAIDVVIMSKEGLNELVAEGKIVPGSVVDLAETPLGVGVRAGTTHPDIRTVEAFKQTLLRAKSVELVSTTGVYMTETLLPKLGIAKEVAAKATPSAIEAVAKGEVELAIRPMSELVNVPGVDYVGPVPAEIQFVSIFSAAQVATSKQMDAGKRLIAFLSSDSASAAMPKNGMEPAKRAHH